MELRLNLDVQLALRKDQTTCGLEVGDTSNAQKFLAA